MKNYSKTVMRGAENNTFVFKRTLLAVSLLVKESNQDCAHFKSWVITNYYSKYKDEINYVFDLDLERNRSEYSIARHLANKILYQYNKNLYKQSVAV